MLVYMYIKNTQQTFRLVLGLVSNFYSDRHKVPKMDRFLVSKTSRSHEILEPSVVLTEEPDVSKNSKKSVPSRSPAEIFQSFKAKDKAKDNVQQEIVPALENDQTAVGSIDTDLEISSNISLVDYLSGDNKHDDPKKSKSTDSKPVSIKSLLMGPKQTKKDVHVVEDDPTADPYPIPTEGMYDLSAEPDVSVISSSAILIKDDDKDDAISITDEKIISNSSQKLKFKDGKFSFGSPQHSRSIDLTNELRTVSRPSRQFKVILKISPEKLDKFRGLNITPKKKAHMNSFFAEVAERAKRESALSQLAILPQEKQKNMALPIIKHDQFLVSDKSDSNRIFELKSGPTYLDTLTPVKLSLGDEEIRNLKSVDELRQLMRQDAEYRGFSKSTSEIYETQILLDYLPADISSSKYVMLYDIRMQRLLAMADQFRKDNKSQWCDLFSPHLHQHILQPNSFNSSLNVWLKDAFTSLKKIDKSKRAEKLKGKRKKTPLMDDGLYDFIDYDDGQLDETFVPSLILEGPTGCGKTSSIYATIKHELDGHIFELNSSQDRSKKAINFHLKQIATTLRVRENTQENKDVILLDDVDTIDTEEDKEFWSSVLDLLSSSYRPVIFTTSDISTIPENVVQESTILNLKRAKKSTLSEYLGISALCMGYDIEMDILKKLCTRDVRSSLLQLQMFCYKFDSVDIGIMKIRNHSHNKDKNPQQSKEKEITLKDILQDHESLDSLLATYHCKVATTKINSDEPKKINLGMERLKYADFSASKLFSIGSRKKGFYYRDGMEIIEQHPTCLFNVAADKTFFTEITPFIKEMAKVEQSRVDEQLDQLSRKFGRNPKDIFEDL